jgi:hypothetical protein
MANDSNDGTNSNENVLNTPIKKAGRPPKPDFFHYTRVAFAPDVWHAMKYKKLMGDETFTDQINKAMRQYLGLKPL